MSTTLDIVGIEYKQRKNTLYFNCLNNKSTLKRIFFKILVFNVLLMILDKNRHSWKLNQLAVKNILSFATVRNFAK